MPTTDRKLYSSAVRVQMASSVTQTELTIPPSQNLILPKPVPKPTSQNKCSHSPSKSSQSHNSNKPSVSSGASTYEAHLRRTPAQQPPISPVVQRAALQSPRPVPAAKPAITSAGKPVQGATASGNTPRGQSSSAAQTSGRDLIHHPNSFSALSTPSGSDAMDAGINVDDGMEVEGRGNSPKKRPQKNKKDRERIFPPP